MPKNKKLNLIANVKMPNISFINKYIINSGVRGGWGQYLNCWGDASPHRELASPHRNFASPHRDLGVPPSRFERWMIRQKRPNFSRNFGEKTLQVSAKTFFFLVFIQFRRRNHVIFTKVLSHAKCVWSGLQKRPPMQNSTI